MIQRDTKTKNLVANLFRDSRTPITLSEVFRKVSESLPTTAYSTVYRIVQSMARDKKIISLDFKERGGRFEWAQREHHHHLTCSNCGNIKDLDESIINFQTNKIAQKTGFIINKHIIELTGICSSCQKNDN